MKSLWKQKMEKETSKRGTKRVREGHKCERKNMWKVKEEI